MTLRIGIVGPGAMGRAHVERITGELSGARITAVQDLDADNAARVAGPLGATVHADAEALVASDDVDAVMVTCHGPAHEGPVTAAVAAGKPVFCEKPLAPTAAECLRIMEAEQKAGRRLVTVGFMRRFDASYRQLKAVLDSGELGEALMVHNRHRNPSVPDFYTADMAVNDTAIHEIDTMRWLLGEEIVSVRVDRPRRNTRAPGRLQDPIVLVMSTASGVRIDDEVFVTCDYGYDIRCELVMEAGTASLGDQELITRRDAHGARNAITPGYVERFHAAFNTEVQQWIRAASRGEHTGSTAWDGYAAAVVCDAGVRSLMGGASEDVAVSLVDRPDLYAG